MPIKQTWKKPRRPRKIVDGRLQSAPDRAGLWRWRIGETLNVGLVVVKEGPTESGGRPSYLQAAYYVATTPDITWEFMGQLP